MGHAAPPATSRAAMTSCKAPHLTLSAASMMVCWTLVSFRYSFTLLTRNAHSAQVGPSPRACEGVRGGWESVGG